MTLRITRMPKTPALRDHTKDVIKACWDVLRAMRAGGISDDSMVVDDNGHDEGYDGCFGFVHPLLRPFAGVPIWCGLPLCNAD